MTAQAQVDLRPPTLNCAQVMFDIASKTTAVDTCPEYFYLTMCRDFATTSLVAHEDRRPIAYAIAYAKHEDPSVLFIWQLAAIQKPRSRGVVKKLICKLIENRLPGLAYLEATIDLNNSIIYSVLAQVAKDYGVVMETTPLYEDHHFKCGHHAENLVKICPFGAKL